MLHQLRTYQLFAENEQAFYERFREHAARLMATHGFRIVAGWSTSSDGGPTFVYLLEWPDETTMRDRWAAFTADEEWAAIKRDTTARHGELVGTIEDVVLTPIDGLPTLHGSGTP